MSHQREDRNGGSLGGVVQTVTGPVASAELGPTLVHEHLRVSRDDVAREFPHAYGPSAAMRRAIEAVAAARDLGVRTICDATVLPLGRDVHLMRKVSEATNVRIVAATGIYTLDALPIFFGNWAAADIAAVFVHDLNVGIQGTTARAHFLKCATGPAGVTEGVRRVLEAVAIAHVRTGAPIVTHAVPVETVALRQQDVLAAAGVDLRKVVVGHAGDSVDILCLEEIAKRGSFLGLDRLGTGEPISDEARIETVLRLCDRGLIDNVLLSHDHASTTDKFSPEDVRRVRPNWRLTYLWDGVVPALERGGLSKTEVERITVQNPRRWLDVGLS